MRPQLCLAEGKRRRMKLNPSAEPAHHGVIGALAVLVMSRPSTRLRDTRGRLASMSTILRITNVMPSVQMQVNGDARNRGRSRGLPPPARGSADGGGGEHPGRQRAQQAADAVMPKTSVSGVAHS